MSLSLLLTVVIQAGAYETVGCAPAKFEQCDNVFLPPDNPLDDDLWVKYCIYDWSPKAFYRSSCSSDVVGHKWSCK